MIKRILLIVLDSFGIGYQPDAEDFGDVGANTLRSVMASQCFNAETLKSLGLFNIDGVEADGVVAPLAAYGRGMELSRGKDTTVGHWEIAGVVSSTPLPTYPEGFPREVIEAFEKATGRGTLCNKPYSGTKVISDYGDEHVKTGKLIVYTSADSVFQIAAHEDVVPVDELYRYCRIAREILQGQHGVGRVIARPFAGKSGEYYRTSGRHDYSIDPPKTTVTDLLSQKGLDVIAVGKINDIFNGRGITRSIPTKGNADGMRVAKELLKENFHGMCFVNLVDFDMLYGHRNDVDGYAEAISAFDSWLAEFLAELGEDDVVIITADHGCDPGYTKTTDHSREYVPVLIYGKKIKPVGLGTLNGFCGIGATVAECFGAGQTPDGQSFLDKIL